MGQRVADTGRLCELYMQLPDASRFAEKVRMLAQAGGDVVGKGNPVYPKFRHLEAMGMRLSPQPQAEDLGEGGKAAALDREAYERCTGFAPGEALKIAAEWGQWAWDHEQWSEAGEAFVKANRSLRTYVRQISDPDERMNQMRQSGYGSRAAFAYLKLDNPGEAIVELERGNELHFSLHDQRWMLQKLAERYPEESARLDQAAAEMHGLLNADGSLPYHEGTLPPEYVAASKKRDLIVYEIRRLPGFQSFGLAARIGDIVPVASNAPLVYLVMTDKGFGVAGVASEGADGKFAWQTGPLTTKDFGDATRAFFDAEFGTRNGDPAATLAQLLEWLRLHITPMIDSVVASLGQSGESVFVQPVGLLSLLPLHVRVTRSADGTATFSPHRTTFFYWAGGLAHSFQRRNERAAEGSLVINNPMPLPVLYDPLQLADAETEMVLSHVPGVQLRGEDADTHSVLEALPAAWLAHFCSHGSVDRRFLYTSILILADNQILMYKQLRDCPPLRARLVVLSACRSGAAALMLDQVLSLPAQFLAAGAAAVLGTFWHTDEMATLLFMVRFYFLWCDRSFAPEAALYEAQTWLMTSTAGTLRAAAPASALGSPAADFLQAASEHEIIYRHPWYWAAFFLAGA